MKTPFERFLNVRWAAGPTFRHDGKRLAFRTDITGVAQVWTLAEPQGWPTQLTFDEDRVVFAEYAPITSQIAFGRDRGGDENMRVFLVDDQGGELRQLSVVDAKHMWGGWSPDGTQIAWVHNGRNGRDFDVYVYDLEHGVETCVFEASGYWYVMNWTPDGRGLLLGHAESNENSEVYLLQIGEAPQKITPSGYAFFDQAVLTPDGRSVFATTNLGTDFMHVVHIDLETLRLEPFHTPVWDVEMMALSKDGHTLGVVENVNGYSRVCLKDTTTGEIQEIAIEGGVVSSFAFVLDSRRLAMTLGTSTRSPDIYTIEDGATERWTLSSMAGLVERALCVPELVHYDSFDDRSIPGFLYGHDLPDGFGVVIDIHGGPEAQRRPAFSAVTQYLVGEGVAVFAPNVRGSRGYGKTYMSLDNGRKRMDSVRDIRAAYDFLVGLGADPNRIALMGGSYGGFMVLSSLVTYPELWAAGVDIVGIANFVTFLENTSEYRRAPRELEYGSLANDREFLESISPANHLHKIAAPLLVIHGRNDPRVPVGEAELVVSTAAQNGVEVGCIIYDDEGHGLAKRRNRLDAYPKIADFLKKHLGVT